MNIGENTNFFRESFRGFNKDDVAEYIIKLTKDYAANEEKYKEHIARLKAGTGGADDSDPGDGMPDANIQKLKDEIGSLTWDLSEKDRTINSLRAQLDSGGSAADASGDPLREEELEKEISELKEKCASLESEIAALLDNKPKIDADAVNQLSFQLAESESERMYVFNLLKKFIVSLDIESAQGKDTANAASVSDIAPKAVISGEIESGLAGLAGLKERADDLEAENAGIKERLEEIENQSRAALATEEQMYKRVMAKLGETVYSANKSADETIAKADGEAEEIIDRANVEAAVIIDRATAKSDALKEECAKRTSEIMEKYAFIREEHENMFRKYKEASEAYAEALSEIGDAVDVICESINESENVSEIVSETVSESGSENENREDFCDE